MKQIRNNHLLLKEMLNFKMSNDNLYFLETSINDYHQFILDLEDNELILEEIDIDYDECNQDALITIDYSELSFKQIFDFISVFKQNILYDPEVTQ
jgi:hypothetical protein